jgi:DEAD/DEAH box helicase domain-containing protein
MRDVDTLMAQGQLPEGSQVPVQMAQVLPWVVNAEFGQDAHVGRTLVATGTACVTPVDDALATAIAWLQVRLGEQVDVLKGNGRRARGLLAGARGRDAAHRRLA